MDDLVKLPVDSYVHPKLIEAASDVARLLGAMLYGAATLEDDVLIQLFSLFPKIGLGRALGGDRIKRARDNLRNFPLLFDAADVAELRSYKPSMRPEGSTARRQRRAERLAREGDIKRANQSAFGTPPADMGDPTVCAQILSKFPQVPTAPETQMQLPKPFAVDVEKVSDALSRMDARSAPGISGLSTRLLKTFWHIKEWKMGITRLVGFYANGLVSTPGGRLNHRAEYVKSLMGARVLAFPKSDGTKSRPVCILEAVYRLAAKLGQEAAEPQKILAPCQLGVGSRMGAEPLVHLARAHHEAGMYISKVDIKNAFGEVSRAALFAAVQANCPQLTRLFAAKYGGPTPVLYCSSAGEVGHFDCVAGQQQGDPLASLGFSLALKEPILQICTELCARDPSMQAPVNAYVDDVHFFTRTSELGSWAQTRFAELVGPLNLSVSVPKSEQIPPNSPNAHRIVGGLIGNSSAVEAAIQSDVEDLVRRMDEVSGWELHPAYLIMRHCLWSELGFAMRTNPLAVTKGPAEHFSEAAHRAVARMLSLSTSSLNSIQALKAGMRRADGGLGLPHSSGMHVAMSYAASVVQSHIFWQERQVPLPPTFINDQTRMLVERGARNMNIASSQDLLGRSLRDVAGLQSRMMEREHLRTLLQLYTYLDAQDGPTGNELRLRADEARGKLATAALADIPIGSIPDAVIPCDAAYRAHMRFVLGVPQLDLAECPPVCPACTTLLRPCPTLGEPHEGSSGSVPPGAHGAKFVDQHARACMAEQSALATRAHDRVVSILLAAAKADGRTTALEPHVGSGASRRRADAMIGPPGPTSGKNQDASLPEFWDVSLCTLSLPEGVQYPKLPTGIRDLGSRDEVVLFKQYLAAHQTVSFQAIDTRRSEKISSYKKIVPTNDFRVFPWVVSTNGGSDSVTDKAIPKAGNTLKGRWYTRIKLSNTLIRFNYACFERWRLQRLRVPGGRDL
jgi:hypothetical protein